MASSTPRFSSASPRKFLNAEYDAEPDLLRRLPAPTLPTPVPPEPIRDGTKLRTYSSPHPRQGPLFTTEKPVPPQPRSETTGLGVTSILAALFALGGLALTAFMVLFLVELIDTYRRRRR